MPRNRTQRRAAAKASAKVKEDENDGDSEWEQSQEEEESSFDESLEAEESSQGNDEEEYSEEEEPKKKPAKKKRKAIVYDDSDSNEEEEDTTLPSYARKTAKGGYAHTTKSRARISKANKGNTPWNKGKNRSAGVKAKIAAGVRARNRAILLEKLKKLNMTEQEWLDKKKEIKYLRERVRRAKKAAAQRETDNNKQRKGKDADKSFEQLQNELSAKLAEQMQAMNPKVEDDKKPPAKKTKTTSTTTRSNKNDLLKQVFKPHVEWTKHDYDTHERLYEQLCPTGGPGGLGCCAVCSSAYSRYLNQTSQDIEVQSIHNAASEVQECMNFMQETRGTLQKKIVLARQQAVPLKRGDYAAASTMNVEL